MLTTLSFTQLIKVCPKRVENLHSLQKWSNEIGLKFNEDKTFAINFSKKRIGLEFIKLKLNSKIINVVNNIKYLGITFDKKLTFSSHINDIKAKAMKALNILKILSSTHFGSDQKLQLRLLNSVLLPIVDYQLVKQSLKNLIQFYIAV